MKYYIFQVNELTTCLSPTATHRPPPTTHHPPPTLPLPTTRLQIHFGNLQIAFLSLFRAATCEDWTDIMYINMFGCEEYGYNEDDGECKSSSAMGWMAAFYFVLFVIIGGLVLLVSEQHLPAIHIRTHPAINTHRPLETTLNLAMHTHTPPSTQTKLPLLIPRLTSTTPPTPVSIHRYHLHVNGNRAGGG